MRVLTFKKVMDAKSALNEEGKILPDVGRRTDNLTAYVVFSTGTTAGTVVIEAAHDDTFTGTWANLATVAWAAANRVHQVDVKGNQRAIRARISVAITGGTVDVHIQATN